MATSRHHRRQRQRRHRHRRSPRRFPAPPRLRTTRAHQQLGWAAAAPGSARAPAAGAWGPRGEGGGGGGAAAAAAGCGGSGGCGRIVCVMVDPTASSSSLYYRHHHPQRRRRRSRRRRRRRRKRRRRRRRRSKQRRHAELPRHSDEEAGYQHEQGAQVHEVVNVDAAEARQLAERHGEHHCGLAEQKGQLAWHLYVHRPPHAHTNQRACIIRTRMRARVRAHAQERTRTRTRTQPRTVLPMLPTLENTL